MVRVAAMSLLLLAIVAAGDSARAEPVGPSNPIAVPPPGGAVLYHDSFDKPEFDSAWDLSQKSFAVKDGALVGGMRDGGTHPAIAKVSKDFRDIVLQFTFTLKGSTAFSVVFNDVNEKSVHSGHVARMTVSPAGLTLTDDKSGLMSLQWVDKKRDPKFKDEIDKVRSATSRRFPMEWEQGRAYTLVLEVVGDRARVSVDGKFVGEFSGPGFAQPNKTSFHFSVSGRDLCVDDLTAWAIKR